MHKDEWGMIVNAPAPPGAGEVMPTSVPASGTARAVAPDQAFSQKASFLLPGEILLWQGAPRKGAGWRCILRDADFGPALGGIAVAMVFAIVASVSGGEAISRALASAIGFVLLSGAITLFVQQQLRGARYAVTDRRSIVIRGGGHRPKIESIHHAAAAPQRRETRCGTTIALGQGVRGNAAAAWRERAKTPVARFFSQPSDNDPQIVFRALDPEDAPFELLRSLVAAAAPAPRFRPTPPIPGGFVQ